MKKRSVGGVFQTISQRTGRLIGQMSKMRFLFFFGYYFSYLCLPDAWGINWGK